MQGQLDPDRHREAWAALDLRERRRIIKAVNRGRALDDVRDARLAVGVASNQMRFWRWAWLIGPAGALFQLGRGLVEFAVNVVVATAVIGGLSWWFHRRAARARAVNLEVATTGRGRPSPGRGAPRHTPTPPAPSERFEDFRPDPNTSRKKVRRRRKRR